MYVCCIVESEERVGDPNEGTKLVGQLQTFWSSFGTNHSRFTLSVSVRQVTAKYQQQQQAAATVTATCAFVTFFFVKSFLSHNVHKRRRRRRRRC